MDASPWAPVALSIQIAAAASLCVLPIGLLLAWWVAFTRRKWLRIAVETVMAVPLVLPPTVAGFYLLMLLGRGTSFGRLLNDTLGLRLLFTWQAAAIASAFMGMPLFAKSASTAIRAINREYLEMAVVLGAGKLQIFRHVVLPLTYRGLIGGFVLSFARGLGEFGATLMVAGSIPGRTQTMPLAVYAAWQNGDDALAFRYTLGLTITAFVVVGITGFLENRIETGREGR